MKDWLKSKEVWVILIEGALQILQRFFDIELLSESTHLTISGILLLILRVFFTKQPLSFFGLNVPSKTP